MILFDEAKHILFINEPIPKLNFASLNLILGIINRVSNREK